MADVNLYAHVPFTDNTSVGGTVRFEFPDFGFQVAVKTTNPSADSRSGHENINTYGFRYAPWMNTLGDCPARAFSKDADEDLKYQCISKKQVSTFSGVSLAQYMNGTNERLEYALQFSYLMNMANGAEDSLQIALLNVIGKSTDTLQIGLFDGVKTKGDQVSFDLLWRYQGD